MTAASWARHFFSALTSVFAAARLSSGIGSAIAHPQC